MRRMLSIGALAVCCTVAGCASAGAGATERRDQTVLTQEELQSAGARTLFEAVQRLRPRWIAVRSQQSLANAATEVLVYQNNTLLGGPEVLRDLAPDAAAWMKYLDGPTAAATLPGLGTRQVEGAIVIHTRPRSP